ncbi:DUF72 domain-containing protein [Desertivirga brevis]|uniref:DUF72 domain-containing protein n=1 Tax=Desertivirga brevis TaxID=2810310 RepID=UPI001A9764F4|nr:DUF72 domain-containing protein [Pedobacter sp. SYSU D00873]
MGFNRSQNIYSGTSGLVLPVKNKLSYPLEFQDKPRLCFYASLMNSIEINSSFYKLPMAKTVAKWADSVPDDFRFTFKMWRDITHNKGLTFNNNDVVRFIDVISNVGIKKGCVLVQFPPSLTNAAFGKLETLLQLIQEQQGAADWKIALELSNASWYNDELFELMEQSGASLVIHDKLESSNLLTDNPAEFIYLRFHGPGGNYRGSYSDEFLNEFSYYIRDWQEEGKTVYIYFNNTMGDAIGNLATLNKYINSNDL